MAGYEDQRRLQLHNKVVCLALESEVACTALKHFMLPLKRFKVRLCRLTLHPLQRLQYLLLRLSPRDVIHGTVWLGVGWY